MAKITGRRAESCGCRYYTEVNDDGEFERTEYTCKLHKKPSASKPKTPYLRGMQVVKFATDIYPRKYVSKVEREFELRYKAEVEAGRGSCQPQVRTCKSCEYLHKLGGQTFCWCPFELVQAEFNSKTEWVDKYGNARSCTSKADSPEKGDIERRAWLVRTKASIDADFTRKASDRSCDFYLHRQ